ncbi:hypothetical protein ACLKA6_000216 [Drosophila palustris]
MHHPSLAVTLALGNADGARQENDVLTKDASPIASFAMDTPRKICQINCGATAEKSPKCSNCKSMEELKVFFKSEMAVMSGQFKLVLEEQAQQKIQIAQLLRDRSEAEGLSSLFPVTDKDELICLDHQIELGNRNCFYSIPPDNGVRLLTNDEEVLALSAGIMIAKATGPDEIPNVLYIAFWRERCQGDGGSNV